MLEIDRPSERQPLNSLAARLVLLVFVSTFAVALIVSAISIPSTRAAHTEALAVRYGQIASQAAARLDSWRVHGTGEIDDRMVARLSDLLPDPQAVFTLSADDGPTLERRSRGLASPQTQPLVLARDATGIELIEVTSSAGMHVISAGVPLASGGLRVAIEVPFDIAYAPVSRRILWAFLLDLAVILLASYLTFRITTVVLKPIESLSDAAARVADGDFDLEIGTPSTEDEIALLARSFNDMVHTVRQYQTEIEARNTTLLSRNNDLQQANEILEQLSITDGLTQLHNHRFFQDHLTLEINRVERSGEPLTLLLLDIDDFKSLNDRFGHAAGDELLLGLARILNECVRDSDLLARYGGEEFAVLASNTDRQGGYALAEKLRMSVAEASFILDETKRPTRITISIGVSQLSGNRKQFFGEADRALYRAKHAGKNCVALDDPDTID